MDHTNNISKYSSLAGSSYIRLSKELDHPKKNLIDIQNFDDNQCFIGYLMGYLHPAHHYPERTTKIDKMFGERLDLKGINFSVEIRVDYKIENKEFYPHGHFLL